MSLIEDITRPAERPAAAIPLSVAYTVDEVDDLDFYPLTAPGIPMPGLDFETWAMALGDDKIKVAGKGKDKKMIGHGDHLERLYRCATYVRGFTMNVKMKGQPMSATLIPGHLWFDDCIMGPCPAKVMVIGKWPGHEEKVHQRNFHGPSGEIMLRALEECKVPQAEYANWYVTNIVKHPNVDPSNTRLNAMWVKNCLPILHQELRLVKPDYILCLGTEATHIMIGESMGGVTMTQGRIFDYSIQLNRSVDEPPVYHIAKLMTCLHPAAVAHSMDMYADFRAGVANFVSLCTGQGGPIQEKDLDCQRIYHERQLAQIVDDILAEPNNNCIAIDSEWHGDYPIQPGAWLRTLQFSHKSGKAFVVVLRHQGGATAFVPEIESAIPHLKRLLLDTADRKVRIIGHNLRADLPWINHLDEELGEGLMRQFTGPEDDPEELILKGEGRFGWQKTDTEGGFDTMLAVHAIQEVAGPFGFKLEVVCNQYCGLPRWDRELQRWKKEKCKELKRKEEELEGYGDCPDDILLGSADGKNPPYAGWDAAGTWELFDLLNKPGGLLDSDRFGNNCRQPFWISMRASPACLEMEMTGLYIDRQRAEDLATLYKEMTDSMTVELRGLINWPNFNPRSTYHCANFLFGDAYSPKIDKLTGKKVPVRPAGAMQLCIEPLTSSGKPKKNWEQIKRRNEEHLYNPSTDKEVLGILITKLPEKTEDDKLAKKCVIMLRNIRFLGSILARVISPPVLDEEDEEDKYERDEDGNMIFDKGLVSWVHTDSRIRTHLFQTKETGRFSSARPPLMNLSKRREADYARILGDDYKYPIRSMFATTPGYAMVETDYIGAELMMMAMQSGDDAMVDHCRRADLPDSDPRKYDIHSTIAVQAFQLRVESMKTLEAASKKLNKPINELGVGVGDPLPCLKSWLGFNGNNKLRDVAKCVVAGSRLLTDRGWIKIEDLCGHLADGQESRCDDGLRVLIEGYSTEVIGFYNGGHKECVTVKTEDGFELTSTTVHQYRVLDNDGNYIWKEAGQLCTGDWVTILDHPHHWTGDHTYPVVEVAPVTSFKDVDFPKEFDEDWAAFLGLYVSEGSANPESGAVQICLAVEEDAEFGLRSMALLCRLFGDRVKVSIVTYENWQDQVRFVVNSVKLARWLAVHAPGQARDKVVPEFVFCWSPSLQAVFLRWLFEGDGTVKANGRGYTIEYGTASVTLAKEVQVLLTGFGIYTRRHTEYNAEQDWDYQVLTLKYNESRDRFVSQIGFVTATKSGRCNSTVGYGLDWGVIPNQLEQLKEIFSNLRGMPREKVRECLRPNNRVRLNRSRLRMATNQLRNVAPLVGTRAYLHLDYLANLPVRFDRVESVISAGTQQVYDVGTTSPNTVCYNGYVTHQTIMFGIPYGRGDEAVLRAVEEEGVSIALDDARMVRRAIADNYPCLESYFMACQARVEDPGWMATWAGRYRRFPYTKDENILQAMKREAGNFPIQGGVADLLSRALDLLYYRADRHDHKGLRYRMMLPVHDAILFEVRMDCLEWFLGTHEQPGLVTQCMSGVPVYQCDLSGTMINDSPCYYFGAESSIYCNWGIKFTREEGIKAGLPARYLPKEEKK